MIPAVFLLFILRFNQRVHLVGVHQSYMPKRTVAVRFAVIPAMQYNLCATQTNSKMVFLSFRLSTTLPFFNVHVTIIEEFFMISVWGLIDLNQAEIDFIIFPVALMDAGICISSYVGFKERAAMFIETPWCFISKKARVSNVFWFNKDAPCSGVSSCL